MQWRRSAEYTPLPTSTTSDPLNEFPPVARSAPFPSSPRQRWNKVYYLLIGCSILIVLSSLFVVPEEHLPSSVSSAVGKSKEAFDAARLNWGWQSEEALEEEIKELEEENGFEGLTEEFEKEVESEVKEDKAAGSSLEVEKPSEGGSGDSLDTLECTDEVRTMLGDPLFWIVEREFLFSRYQAKLSGLNAISFSQNRTTRPIRSALATVFPPTSLPPASLKPSSQLV